MVIDGMKDVLVSGLKGTEPTSVISYIIREELYVHTIAFLTLSCKVYFLAPRKLNDNTHTA
jgi:hypothetical protein